MALENEIKHWIKQSDTVNEIMNRNLNHFTDQGLINSANSVWIRNNIENAVVRILTELAGTEKIKIAGDKISPFKLWEIAQIRINVINEFIVNKLSWDSVKVHAVQMERKRVLEQIVEKKIESRKNLLPLEQLAINDKLTENDIPFEKRKDIYLGFIEHRVRILIWELRSQMHDDPLHFNTKRQDQKRELHKLYSDKVIITEGH